MLARPRSFGGPLPYPAGALRVASVPGKIPLTLIDVQSGAYLGEDDIILGEDDIIRLDDVYNRTSSD